MNQRLERVNQCHPMVRQPVLQLVERCTKQLKRTLLVTQGFRSVSEQLLIYQKGREYDRENQVWRIVNAKEVVTKALPGLSAHNVITHDGAPASMAVDVIPFKADGTIDWQVSDEFWDALYEIAWKVGLDPLGDPIGSHLAGDKGHFEEPAWKLKLDGLGCYQPVNIAPQVTI